MKSHLYFLLIICSLFFTTTNSLSATNINDNITSCSYDSYPNQPEVYYINLKKSVDRRNHMIELLTKMKLRHFRVEGKKANVLFIRCYIYLLDVELTHTHAT